MVVAPLLHNRLPVATVDKVEEPQLLATVTTGAEGIAIGAAIPEPEALVQPLIVWVTVKVPAEATVIDEVVAPLLHNRFPVATVDKVEEPQLLTTVTTGAVGITAGAAIPDPGKLVQPLLVCVTV